MSTFTPSRDRQRRSSIDKPTTNIPDRICFKPTDAFLAVNMALDTVARESNVEAKAAARLK